MDKLIIDDHKLFNDGLKALITTIDRFSVIHQLYESNEVLEFLEKNPNIGLIFMDFNMPIKDGKELSKEILSIYPSLKILIITMYADKSQIEDFKKLGAHGYILKSVDLDELSKAVLEIQRGNTYFPIAEAITVNDKDDFFKKYRLTKRETEILELISLGKSTNEISESLYLSVHTINTHRKNLHLKLDVQNERELMKFAQKIGF
jgi:DNA-binding NarL/FixJ family response regulator